MESKLGNLLQEELRLFRKNDWLEPDIDPFDRSISFLVKDKLFEYMKHRTFTTLLSLVLRSGSGGGSSSLSSIIYQNLLQREQESK